jgi:hypothetical protein
MSGTQPLASSNLALDAALRNTPLMERAAADLIACQEELLTYHWNQERCNEIVTLLDGALRVARLKGDDGRLNKTYQNIYSTVQNWAFESIFKRIFRQTVHELDAGIIAHPISLFEANTVLQRDLVAAQARIQDLEEMLAEERAEMKYLQTALTISKESNTLLKLALEEKKGSEGEKKTVEQQESKPLMGKLVGQKKGASLRRSLALTPITAIVLKSTMGI